jgi:prepilin-type N-terminal cleavage/methylation domain-containing protein
MNRRIAHRTRPGFTLREVSLAMAIGSSVMMAAVGTLHHAFDWASTARARRADDQTFFRLTRWLRRDVHRATDVSLQRQAENGRATLAVETLAGTSIRYDLDGQAVTRLQPNREGEPGREVFRFKQPRQISLSRTAADEQIQLSVKAAPPAGVVEAPLWRQLRVTPGLRLRHQRGEIQ